MAKRSRRGKRPSGNLFGRTPEPITREELQRLLRRKGGVLQAGNTVSRYLFSVEDALKKLKRTPRARLTNQEAYDLSAAIRKARRPSREWAMPFAFKPADERRADKWYASQSTKARRNLPKKFRPIVKQWVGYRLDKQGTVALAFLPADPKKEPLRKFTHIDAMVNFLGLPHYKEARDRLSGHIAIVKTSRKTGEIKSTIRKVKI